MPILQLIAKIQDVLPFRTGKSTKQRKFTFAELQELAEQDDFGRILDTAGIPNPPIPGAAQKKWSEGVEFDASIFDDAAYKKYEEDYFKK